VDSCLQWFDLHAAFHIRNSQLVRLYFPVYRFHSQEQRNNQQQRNKGQKRRSFVQNVATFGGSFFLWFHDRLWFTNSCLNKSTVVKTERLIFLAAVSCSCIRDMPNPNCKAKPLSIDLSSPSGTKKFHCFRARDHCFGCLFIVLSCYERCPVAPYGKWNRQLICHRLEETLSLLWVPRTEELMQHHLIWGSVRDEDVFWKSCKNHKSTEILCLLPLLSGYNTVLKATVGGWTSVKVGAPPAPLPSILGGKL